jgi:DNA repair protein RadA/Sms
MKCNAWNTLVEDVVNVGKKDKVVRTSITLSNSLEMADIKVEEKRIKTKIGELDRVLGGGFMEDSLVLLVGDPGIGKSTLTIQACDRMAAAGRKVIYFSGEESVHQISSRAKRLGLSNPISVANNNHLETIIQTIESEKPGFVVVDSVQVMASDEVESQAGSISQVRHVAERLMEVAKTGNIPILLIGHVNKEGQLAGPQVLTHLVDTVLYLEGDRFHQFRMLRATKNRFGAVDEVGVFQMEQVGLMDVKNPSAIFLEGRSENPIGSVIFPAMEGTRTFLVEVQALTSHTQFGYPKRTASGFDLNRLNIIIAILNRYTKLNLDSSDVFVNVVGGLRLSEPGADLAVALAIASSKLKKPLPTKMAALGELGLSGEIRMASHLEKRMGELEKLGFNQAILPSTRKPVKSKLDLIEGKGVGELLNKIFVQAC